VHWEGGVPGRVSVSGSEHPGLQAAGGRGSEVRRHPAGVGGAGQASGAELWAEEASGGGEQEEEPGRGKRARVGFTKPSEWINVSPTPQDGVLKRLVLSTPQRC